MNDKVIRMFGAEDWYELGDGRWVATTRNPMRYDRRGCPYIGEPAFIDGEYHDCILGVESFCIPTIVAGAPIGLLVAKRHGVRI